MNVEYTVDECSASSKAHRALSKTISKTITFKFCTMLLFVLLHLKSNFTFPSTLLCVQSNTSELFTLWISLLGTADAVFLWPYLPEMHQAYKIIIPKCNSGESQNLWPNVERSSCRWAIFCCCCCPVRCLKFYQMYSNFFLACSTSEAKNGHTLNSVFINQTTLKNIKIRFKWNIIQHNSTCKSFL